MECEMPEKSKLTLLREKPTTIKLLENLNFSHFRIIPENISPWYDVEVEKGKAQIRSLYYVDPTDDSPGIAVSGNWSLADTIFPCHQHKGVESFLVYRGEMEFYHGNPPDQIKVNITANGKPYYFTAMEKHWAYFPVYTEYIAMTSPPDESWRLSLKKYGPRGTK